MAVSSKRRSAAAYVEIRRGDPSAQLALINQQQLVLSGAPEAASPLMDRLLLSGCACVELRTVAVRELLVQGTIGLTVTGSRKVDTVAVTVAEGMSELQVMTSGGSDHVGLRMGTGAEGSILVSGGTVAVHSISNHAVQLVDNSTLQIEHATIKLARSAVFGAILSGGTMVVQDAQLEHSLHLAASSIVLSGTVTSSTDGHQLRMQASHSLQLLPSAALHLPAASVHLTAQQLLLSEGSVLNAPGGTVRLSGDQLQLAGMVHTGNTRPHVTAGSTVWLPDSLPEKAGKIMLLSTKISLNSKACNCSSSPLRFAISCVFLFRYFVCCQL
jgi:hypothetical protein